MPQIRQFEAPTGLGLHPTETGVQAVAGAARRLQGDYNEAAAAQEATGKRFGSDLAEAGAVAVKYLDHQQISKGANDYADLMARKTQEWNDTIKGNPEKGIPPADPNDPEVARRFVKDSLEPDLEKFKEGFITENGQKFAESHVAQLREHMFHKTTADMATLAGEAAKINHRQTVNSLASAAYGDPSSLEFSLKTLESAAGAAIDGSPNLTGTAAAKVKGELLQSGKEAIIKSAIMGMIERNPNVDLGAIEKKYGEYISGPEMRMFAKAAQTQAKVDALRQKQGEIAQRQLDQQQAHTAANKLMTDTVEIDPATKRPIIKPDFFKRALEIAKMPNAPDGLARTLIDWGEHQQNLRDTAIRSDPVVKQDFTDRMFSSDHPVTEIDLMRAQINGKLSKDDFASMSHMVKTLEESPMKGPIWKDTMDAVKSELVLNIPGIPGKDITGISNYAKFAQAFIPQYQAAVRAGTLPPNALDVKDPDSMISKAMAPFKRSQKDRLIDYTTAAGGINFGGSVPDAKPAGGGRMVSGVPVPPALGGIAALQYNPGKQLWRDTTTGEVYDRQGNKVKP